MTNDIGTSFYISPEQFNGKNISYPTDIFLFSLFVYYVIEKKDLIHENYDMNNEIKVPLIQNASKNIQKLIEISVNIDQTKRPNIHQIKQLLLNEFILPYYIEPYIFHHENELKEFEVNSFFYENFNLRIGNKKQLNKFFDALFLFKKEFFQNYVEKDKKVCMINLSFSDDEDEYEQEIPNEFDYKLNEFEYNEFLSKKNDYNSLLKLGDFYFNGKYVKQDYNKAKKYYQKASLQNGHKAFYNLGRIYFEGLGIKTDYLKAKEYFELAAEKNDSNAKSFLGVIYFYGYGVQINYLLARKYFEDSRNGNSLYHLGIIYYKGLGIEKDLKKSIKYLESAAKKKNPDAFYILGNFYVEGIGVEKDITKAIQFFEFAANKNNSDAMNHLGIHYLNGLGVDKISQKLLIISL